MKSFWYTIFFCFLTTFSVQANNAAYVSLANQVAKSNQIKVFSNNIANKSTTGFQEDIPFLSRKKVKRKKTVVEAPILRTTIIKTRNITPKYTGRELDIAILGKGYLKILSDKGVRYTLNGSMFFDKEKKLVNYQGFEFLDVNNETIIAPYDVDAVSISSNGEILVSKGRQKELIAQIGVFEIEDSSLLRKKGNNCFSYERGTEKISDNYSIKQRMLSQSNVDSTKILSDSIEVENSFSQSVSLISAAFKADKTAIETIMGLR